MAAVYVSNLVINSGATFQQQFNLEGSTANAATNLVGYSIAAQMRKHAGSTGVTTFSASITDAAAGTIKVGLSSVTTAALKSGRYVYDVLLTDPSNEVTRVVEGSVLVRQGVTR